MKVLVAEDDPIQAGAIKMYLRKINFELVTMSEDAEGLLASAKKRQADIALLDIFINGKYDGIQLAQQLKAEGIHIPVVFLTGIKDDSVFERARQAKPQGFLIKPFDELLLKRTLQLAVDLYKGRDTEEKDNTDIIDGGKAFFARLGNSFHKVVIEEIYAVESDGKYILLETSRGSFRLRQTLQSFERHLAPKQFFRAHRGTIINLDFLESINAKSKKVTINGHEYTMSRGAYEELIKRFPSFS